MGISKVIKMKRVEKGMTQRELANKIGVTESAVSRWESGETDNMRRKNIIAISEILGINIEVIMGWAVQDETQNENDMLLSKFHSLTPTNQQTVLGMIDLLLSQQAQEKDVTVSAS